MQACAILTKGTGVCLIPVPVFALILAGKWRNLPLRPMDQLDVETVVVQNVSGMPIPPYQVLLNSVMQAVAVVLAQLSVHESSKARSV